MKKNGDFVRVITPDFNLSLLDCVRELWSYRELLLTLSWREIKIRYKQTVLGVFWAIAQPASLTLIFSIIFGKSKLCNETISFFIW